MKSFNFSSLFKTLSVLTLIGAFALSMAVGQTLTNTGTINNTGTMTVTNLSNTTGTVNNSAGTIKVKDAITNTTADNFDTQTGTVEYIGSSAAQSIISGVKNATYGNLAGRNGGAKSLTGNLTVGGTVTTDGASTTVDVGSYTLTVTGASPIASVSSGVFTAASGTVNYAGDLAQSVYPTTYANLITSGATASRTKTATGAVTVTGALTNGANNILDFSTYAFTGTGATFSNSNLLKSAGAVNVTAGAIINGTFEFYASTGTQTIPAAQFTNLTLSSGSGATGEKDYTSGTTAVSGTYAVSGANRNYGSGTFNYNGSSQSVISDNYYNLTFTGSGLGDVKTAAGAITVGGAFTNALGIGNMLTYGLTITGAKSNSGKMQFAGLSNGVVFADGIVEYNGTLTDAASQSIAAGTYYNLVFTNDAPKNILSGTTVHTTSNLNIGSGVTANVQATGALNVDLDIDNAGTVNNAGTITVGN